MKLLKRGRNGQYKKAIPPLFSCSSISTPELTKDINSTDNKNQRYYSTYTPPPNNKYHGTPVYINIDVNDNISDAAIARNSDPEAVFVVTGASRKALVLFYNVHAFACHMY